MNYLYEVTDETQAEFDIMLQGDYSKIFIPQSPLLTVKALQSATTPYLETVHSAGEYYADNFCFSEELQNVLNTQLFPIDVYNKMVDASWEISENSSDAKAEKLFSFTKQMASLYNPSSYQKDIVLEMDYTDYNEKHQIVITQTGAKVMCIPLAQRVVMTLFEYIHRDFWYYFVIIIKIHFSCR